MRKDKPKGDKKKETKNMFHVPQEDVIKKLANFDDAFIDSTQEKKDKVPKDKESIILKPQNDSDEFSFDGKSQKD